VALTGARGRVGVALTGAMLVPLVVNEGSVAVQEARSILHEVIEEVT